ncbi:hypothetical protein D9M68_814220 [compost metagenome]
MPSWGSSVKLSSGAHSKSITQPAWLTIILLEHAFGVAAISCMAMATCSWQSTARRTLLKGTPDCV